MGHDINMMMMRSRTLVFAFFAAAMLFSVVREWSALGLPAADNEWEDSSPVARCASSRALRARPGTRSVAEVSMMTLVIFHAQAQTFMRQYQDQR